MKLHIEEISERTLPDAVRIWNRVVEDGVAYPQEDFLDRESGAAFFAEQSFTGIAVDEESGAAVGLYILHPNNVGRCGHIANASYAVDADLRGQGVGEALVRHSLQKGAELGFRILQFNAVVAANTRALALYRSVGFTQLGVIPKGFRMKDGHYEDIIPHYIELTGTAGMDA